MMEGLAFLPVPDLTIGIHLLRTLCPDDPPEAARQHRIWVFVSFVQKIAI
jgi:hypothetical protein